MKKKFLEIYKDIFKYLGLGLAWFIIGMAWLLFVLYWLVWLVFPGMVLIYIFLPLIIFGFIKLNSIKYLNYAHSNVILFGGRGTGKSLNQQYLIFHEKTKPLGNIDFGYNDIVSPFKYYEHIRPNDARAMINNTLVIVKKIEAYESRAYYFDDTNSYAPNTEDAYLKKYYTSMSLFILIQRHLYNSYSVLNAQSLERMYKNLRELQLDGYIKSLSLKGWGWFWLRLPIVRKYVRLNVRYYSQYDSALAGKLPFEKLGILNRTLGVAYTTTPEALKKMYEAENGIIRDFALWLNKKHIKYDTREYHKHIFGVPAPSTQHLKNTGTEAVAFSETIKQQKGSSSENELL